MIIKSLRLKNYRRFADLELELPENLIGIIGSNGVGKTTIVEAIGWCLYGNRIRRTDKQDIRSQFCSEAETCAVELVFICSDNEYRVVRQLKGKAATVEAAVYRQSQTTPVAVQERGVNEFIEQLLNLDYRSFFISVFAKQRDLAALSELQPEERRKSIARLINIEAIDRARNDIRADRTTHEARLLGFKSSLKDEQTLKAQQKQLKLELSAAEQSKKELEAQLKQAQSRLQKLKIEFEKLSQLRDLYQQGVARIDKWRSRSQDFEARKQKALSQIEAIQKAEQELARLKPLLVDFNRIQREKDRLDKESTKYSQLKAKEAEKQRLSQRITREQFQLTRLEEELKGLAGIDQRVLEQEQKIAGLESTLDALRERLTEIRSRRETVEQKGKEIREKKEQVEKLGRESPCPICTRPLQDHYDRVIEEFQAELNQLRQKFLEYRATENQLKEESEKIAALIKTEQQLRDGLLQAQQQFREREKQRLQSRERLEDSVRSLNQLNAEISAIGKVDYDEQNHQELKKKLKQLTELRDQLLKYEEQVKRLPDEQQELEQINATLKDIAGEIELEQQRLAELNYDEHQFQQAKQAVDEQQLERDHLKEKTHLAEQEIIKIQRDKDHLHDELQTVQKLKEEIELLQESIVYLKALDHHLGIFRQDLLGRIRPLIASRASELLQLTTQGRYSILELDEDYNIFLYDQAQRFPLVRFSGGEQDLANLCLRIAISQVVAERAGRSQINFIVLDEIFGSQDEQRKDLILNALQHLHSQFRQIFVITHVEGIKDVLPVVIAVEEESLDRSIAKIV
ncbi:MAG: SMC family ATPase [candidate division KSB1 bacterium]|nr:SMC family ATPase [candidate division KSB1 bacterium]